jgi:hypothetical protein
MARVESFSKAIEERVERTPNRRPEGARRSAVAMLDGMPVHPSDLTGSSAEEAQCSPDCERSAQVLSGFARQLAISSPEGVKHAEVITGRLIQDERGWLRFGGLNPKGR